MLRCPSSKVVSFSSIDELSKYADKSDTDAIGSRAGTIVTYGPFHKVPITASKDFQKKEQKSVSVHYEYDTAIVTVVELQRFAEISHWGANINIQDSVHLRNDGPVYVIKSYHVNVTENHLAASRDTSRDWLINMPGSTRQIALKHFQPWFYNFLEAFILRTTTTRLAM